MELTINVDALDKSDAAVVSASDRTAVSDIEWLTVGNTEPMTLAFCDDDGATPAFVTDANTVVAVGFGRPDVAGGQLYASNSALSISGSTRTGTLNLNETLLRNAISGSLGCYYCGRRGIYLTLEVRRTTTVATVVTAAETLLLARVFCAMPVLPV